MVRGLVVADPWGLARATLLPVLFHQVVWFAKLAAAYERFDVDHIQAHWKSTHCLWLSKEQAGTNPFFVSYYNARKKRRG
uniref:Uncharacterized protein n=1 Tax=Hyaloperonospora arabidopsidis (strain Emoy2) TaxID=559515 RepID=M4BR81_HYAAE